MLYRKFCLVLASVMILAGCASVEHYDEYSTVTGPVEQQPDAISRWLELANAGNAEAQFQLAWSYDMGSTVFQDRQQAAYWYYKAASQGHANARFNLGVFYATGIMDDTRNYSAALELFRQAAQQDYLPAQFQLGTMYRHGLGVEQSDEQARHFYQQAADQGYLKAIMALGHMDATGAKPNPEAAFGWYHQAAQLGNRDAQYYIARTYQHQQACSEAENWLRRAALQGHSEAQQQLAAMTCSGELN